MRTVTASITGITGLLLAAGVGLGATSHPSTAQRGAQTPPATGEAATGTITGRVTWHGPLPARPSVTPPPSMAACGASMAFQALEVGSDQGVAWTEISVEGATGHASPTHVTLAQHGCEFLPHVLVAPVGSSMSIANHDPLLHNVHATHGGTSLFNVASIQNLAVNQVLSTPGLINLQCDAGHPWMHAYVHVVTDPFHVVTDSHGAFRIEHVPAGHHDIQMWHEGWTSRPSTDGHPAFGPPVTHEHAVDVPAGGSVEVNFTLPS